MYKTGKPICDYLNEEGEKTLAMVRSDYATELKDAIGLLNTQFSVLEQSAWTFAQGHLSGRGRSEPALISALHKGMFLFHSAIELTSRGLYGPARTLLRSIFESQVIAKYSNLDQSSAVFNAWLKGEKVHVTNHIFNRIKKPKVGELKIMWQSLHELAHATVYSQQMGFEYPDTEMDIGATLSLIQIMLCMNQHLLGRHFLTNSTVRYTRMYGDAETFESSRHSARKIVRHMRSQFTVAGKRVVNEYSSTWELKQ